MPPRVNSRQVFVSSSLARRFKSIFAMVPLIIVMVLVLIPAVMTTIAVVREKETGSIANFQSTPISKFEFWWASCSLRRRRYAGIHYSAANGAFRFPRAGQRVFRGLALGTLVYVSRLAVSGNSSRPSPRPR